jgi:addiction module HigA family antidote
MAKRLPPIHSGEVLHEELLRPMKLSPYALAQACGAPRTRIERLAREETPVTANTAMTGTSTMPARAQQHAGRRKERPRISFRRTMLAEAKARIAGHLRSMQSIIDCMLYLRGTKWRPTARSLTKLLRM